MHDFQKTPCNEINAMHDFNPFPGHEIMHSVGYITKNHAWLHIRYKHLPQNHA